MASLSVINDEMVTRSFLEKKGRDPLRSDLLKGDLGSRQFWRLTYESGATEILMVSLPEDHPKFTPGHRLGDYIDIAKIVRAHGLRVPKIYDFDLEAQLCLMEDFGNTTFLDALAKGHSNEELTQKAGEALKKMQDIPAGHLPEFMNSHIMAGHKRFVDWYCPVLFGRKVSDDFIGGFLDVWDGIFQSLPASQNGFVFVDYHFGNIMLLDDGAPGLLDFQGAMHGPLAYDLTNLLQDARRDISPSTRDKIYRDMVAGMTKQEQHHFDLWYDVLACQFHCRVIGQFIKLARLHDKPQHLVHLPRLAGYIHENANRRPVLAPFKQWLADQKIDLRKDVQVDLQALDNLIREDAL